MTKTVKKKKESTRVQVYLNQSTLDLLDFIQEHVPEVESRSAAIRWAARMGVWKLRTYDTETSKTGGRRR